MVVDMARIAQLERELEEARKELWKEDAERYHVLVREMPMERELFPPAASRVGQQADGVLAQRGKREREG